MASTWWNPNGDFKALHDINPSRLDYILSRVRTTSNGFGCRLWRGILTESLEAHTDEIIESMPLPNLKVAQLHAIDQDLEIDYRLSTVETLSKEYRNHFDVLTCMELLEHVTDFNSTVSACADLTRPGGHLFFSTINRNPISFLKLIVGAEEILKILPRGTHEYQKFIKPSELANALRIANLKLLDISGIYNPFTRKTRSIKMSQQITLYMLGKADV